VVDFSLIYGSLNGEDEVGNFPKLWPTNFGGEFRKPFFMEIFTGDTTIQYTLWLFNIAMENGPFIDGLPIKNGDFPWLC